MVRSRCWGLRLVVVALCIFRILVYVYCVGVQLFVFEFVVLYWFALGFEFAYNLFVFGMWVWAPYLRWVVCTLLYL